MSYQVTVAVAPTDTVCAVMPVIPTAYKMGVQVVNLDGAQTFLGTLYWRLSGETQMAPSTLPDFGAIGPGQSVTAVLDVWCVEAVELHGTASGAGLNVRVTWR